MTQIKPYNEKQLPNKVQEVVAFFEENDLWYQLSKNSAKPSGCLDASRKRRINAEIGIPLYQEMKSLLFTFTNNHQNYVLLHCRANYKFSWKKIRPILNTKKLSKATTSDMNKLDFSPGTVNPFNIKRNGEKIIHIFDKKSIVDDLSLKKNNSMMTNAGDLDWGIAFMQNELITYYQSHISDSAILHEITV